MGSALKFKQGDTWSFSIVWRPPIPGTRRPDLTQPPIDITGYDARFQLRRCIGDTEPPMLELTSAPSTGLTVKGPEGTIDALAGPLVTVGVPVGVWPWEVEIANGANVYTLASGPLIVEGQVVQ
jgi:hypothetical protein